MKPFELAIEIPAHPDFLCQAFLGATVVGCLKHDVVCWLLERDMWSCPVCGFRPRPDAPPFVVRAVDFNKGTLTLT